MPTFLEAKQPAPPPRALLGAPWLVVAVAFGCGDRTPLGLGTAVADAGQDAARAVDASSDAPIAIDAQTEAGSVCTAVGACTGQFPAFDDRCVQARDCVLVQHLVSCCGSRVALGIRASENAAFDNAEATWRASSCQEVCDCKAAPLCDDVGRQCIQQLGAQVGCSAGRCRSICSK